MTRPRVILGPSGAYWVRAGTRCSLPLLAKPWAADLLVATLAYFRLCLGFDDSLLRREAYHIGIIAVSAPIGHSWMSLQKGLQESEDLITRLGVLFSPVPPLFVFFIRHLRPVPVLDL